MNDLFFIVFHFAARASATLLLFITIDDLTCELLEIIWHLLPRVKVISTPRKQSSLPPGNTPTTFLGHRNLCWHHNLSYSAAIAYYAARLMLSLYTKDTRQLL